MRVTNSMISNSAAIHITNAKNKYLKYSEQYTSQQKIQRPSDDPTVAVRSLKLRTTYSQLTQYVDNNTKDALNWMDTTESAMSQAGELMTSLKGFLNQGDCDDLTVEDRKSVLSTLQQYVDSIFNECANADYAGRYLFTGYRTDTSLLFGTGKDDLAYKIKENFEYGSLVNVTSVIKGASYSQGTTGQQYVTDQAETTTAYRLQLAYKDCATSMTYDDNGTATTFNNIDIKFYSQTGADITTTVLGGANIATHLSTSSLTSRQVGDNEIVYLNDTGEVLMGKDVYARIQANQAEISVEYCKDKFEKGDIRPEMYFECVCKDNTNGKTIKYTEPEDQKIQYEINYSHAMAVNTQARDAFSTDIYRNIDYIRQTIEAVDEVETKISDCKKMISNTTNPTEKKALQSLQSTLEDERKLRVSVMSQAFGMGLTMVDKTQAKLDIAIADLGAKYNRTQLTYDKLLDTRLDTEQKMSDNEGVDISDVYIGLAQATNLYQASLSTTSKILGNTLLDYI